MSSTEETETKIVSLPEAHYHAAMDCLGIAEKYNVESPERTNYMLEAIAHSMLGGLRDALDYAAKHANQPEPGSPLYPGPQFEEDVDRP